MATQTLITRQVASEARQFCRENGLPVGTRGRLSREQFVRYFLSHPRRAREVARTFDIPVSSRGRLSPVDATKVALTVR